MAANLANHRAGVNGGGPPCGICRVVTALVKAGVGAGCVTIFSFAARYDIFTHIH